MNSYEQHAAGQCDFNAYFSIRHAAKFNIFVCYKTYLNKWSSHSQKCSHLCRCFSYIVTVCIIIGAENMQNFLFPRKLCSENHLK